MKSEPRLIRIQSKFEKIIVAFLIVMLMIVILLTTIEMAQRLLTLLLLKSDIISQMEKDDIYRIFSAFLLVLIGIELLQTMTVYLKDNAIHVETVVLVAIIAVTRHLIDMNYEETDAIKLIGFAALVISLTLGYYYIKKALSVKRPDSNHDNDRPSDNTLRESDQ